MNFKIVNFEGKKCYQKEMVQPLGNHLCTTKKLTSEEVKNIANLEIKFNLDSDKKYYVIEGYANNKLIPGTDEPAEDSYGDIPTGDNVYKIGRLQTNPVLLVNHKNDASKIAGNFIYLKEDDQGLKFKAVLRNIDSIHDLETKDAVQSWIDGYGRALSIGGMFYYDYEKSDPDTRTYILVKAILHETSIVAIGADQYALVDSVVGLSDEDKEVKEALELAIKNIQNADDNSDADALIAELNKIIKLEENNNG